VVTCFTKVPDIFVEVHKLLIRYFVVTRSQTNTHAARDCLSQGDCAPAFTKFGVQVLGVQSVEAQPDS